MIVIEIISTFIILVIASILLRSLVNAMVPFDSVRVAFFFPGILVHEAAHAGISKLLKVPVLQTDFIKGEVHIIREDLTPLKQFIIGISPLFVSWLLGGVIFIASMVLLTVNQWILGICLFFLSLSIYSSASPSLTDLATVLQGKNEIVTTAMWVLISGVIGYLLVFEMSHDETIAIAGAIVGVILGYLVYHAAHNASEEKGKWVI
ncbi:MAG: hypothetical protein ACFFDT_37820 [Candidatus Hodarchaeota archaeon]